MIGICSIPYSPKLLFSFQQQFQPVKAALQRLSLALHVFYLSWLQGNLSYLKYLKWPMSLPPDMAIWRFLSKEIVDI